MTSEKTGLGGSENWGTRSFSGRKFDDEGVPDSHACQRAVAKINCTAVGLPSNHDVASTIDFHGSSRLIVGVAESLAPDMIAVRVELGDEDFLLECPILLPSESPGYQIDRADRLSGSHSKEFPRPRDAMFCEHFVYGDLCGAPVDD